MSKFSLKATAAVVVLGGAIVGATSASAALNLPPQSCSYVFNTNMKLGSRGTDVMNLQKVLNSYSQTRVAESGAGSPGLETSTFGPATRAAVNKFQALHLVDLGITAPTGNVFAGTRALLNQVCSGSTTTTTNPTTTSGPVSAMLSASQPSGMLVQGQAGARLADITFTGNGTVSAVELQRTGVSSDSALNNVYLYDGNVRITDAASVVTGGYIRFNAGSGLFTVNGSRVITVRADIAGSTSGQSVGAKLNSVTVMGGSPTSFTNVMGNTLQIGSATPATVNFSTITVSNTSVDAGTTNYNVWAGTASVGTRDVMLKSATFKFVGSAPADAVANLSLFVDGSKVAGPAMINVANNNKLSFDLGNGILLRTGSRTIEVRGDIVKGSNRTMTFSVENVADLMFEDTSLAGVNAAATVSSSALTQSNSTYRTVTVNSGSVTVGIDPAYTSNKVTGGATNVPVGQFVLKAYGEDVKVNTLRVTFATTTVTTLNNVSLYVNGGQVSTSQNFTVAAATTGYLEFNLGSSLVVPAGTSVVLTVKADIVNASNVAYSSGTIATKIGGASSNAQGQSSNEIVSVASSQVTGNTLTVSSGAGTFTKTAAFFASTVSPNAGLVKIGSFQLTADSAEDIKVTSIGVNPVVTSAAQTNISNLKVMEGSNQVGNPVGNPSAGTSTFSFSDITIPANGTKTFDVYAQIGDDVDGVVTTAMQVTYRGAVSNTTTTSSAAGVAITSQVAVLAAATKVSSSAVAQYVVGGSSQTVAIFKLKTSQGDASVKKLTFSVPASEAIAAITVNGVAGTISGASSTVTFPDNKFIPVSTTGVDVPVIITYAQFKGGLSPASPSTGRTTGVSSVVLTLDSVEAQPGSGSPIYEYTDVDSSAMKLYGSKPVLTGPATSGTLTVGTMKIGQFTVTADANGAIQVASTTLVTSISSSGTTTVTNVHIRENGNTSALTNTIPTATSSTAYTLAFTSAYSISAGQSKTFEVWGTIANVGGFGSAGSSQVSTQLDNDQAGFRWNDTLSGTNSLTGVGILNFPTGSESTWILKN